MKWHAFERTCWAQVLGGIGARAVCDRVSLELEACEKNPYSNLVFLLLLNVHLNNIHCLKVHEKRLVFTIKWLVCPSLVLLSF